MRQKYAMQEYKQTLADERFIVYVHNNTHKQKTMNIKYVDNVTGGKLSIFVTNMDLIYC